MSDQPGWLGGVSGDGHKDLVDSLCQGAGLGLETAGNTKKKQCGVTTRWKMYPGEGIRSVSGPA